MRTNDDMRSSSLSTNLRAEWKEQMRYPQMKGNSMKSHDKTHGFLRMIRATRFRFILLTLSLFYLAGCGSFGPNTVARDRFEYTLAISDSWKRQMLLNMVKIRYEDTPVFMDVASIINQYALEGDIELGARWTDGILGDTQNIGGKGKYADRPTITYQPLVGKKFTQSLMTPIPAESLMAMSHAGWRVDLLMRLCVQSINGINNRSAFRLYAEEPDPEFFRLLSSLRKIQDAHATGVRVMKIEGEKPVNMLFFRGKDLDPDTLAEIDHIKKQLGLNPDLNEYQVVYGSAADNDNQVAILTRSMLQILTSLAAYIDVPQIHADEGRTTPNEARKSDLAAGLIPLIQIQSTADKPKDTFVAIKYRDYWYWIDDKDRRSKRMFTFLMFLFSLAETGKQDRSPVITIPTG